MTANEPNERCDRLDDFLRIAADRSATYLHDLETRSVYPSSAAINRITEMGGELPVSSVDAEKVLALLDEIGSPATVANFAALAAARHAVLTEHGWDVEADGLAGSPPVTVVVSEQAHPTLLKAASLLGFGHKRLVQVPVDEQGRMQVTKLP